MCLLCFVLCCAKEKRWFVVPRNDGFCAFHAKQAGLFCFFSLVLGIFCRNSVYGILFGVFANAVGDGTKSLCGISFLCVALGD